MTKATKQDRTIRALRRLLAKRETELAQTKRKSYDFKKMAFSKKEIYDKEANILRDSLRTMTSSYYKKKKEHRNLLKRKDELKAKNFMLLRMLERENREKARRKTTVTGMRVVRRSMDI